MRKINFSFHSAVLFVLLVIVSSCTNNRNHIPPPPENDEFEPPIVKPIKFSDPQKIEWKITRLDTTKPIEVRKFDWNAIPSKLFDSTDFKPFTRPPVVTKLVWENKDSSFDLNALPKEKLQFKRILLGKPTRIKANLPRLKDGSSENVLMFKEDPAFPGQSVTNIVQDKTGMIWLNTNKGLCRFDGTYYDLFTKREGLAANFINNLALDSIGRIWVSTDHEINIIDMHSGTIDIFQKQLITSDKFTSTFIMDLFVDDHCRVWITTLTGLFFVDKDGQYLATVTSYQPGQAGTKIVSQDASGNIWLTSDPGRISILNFKTGKAKCFSIKGISVGQWAAATPDLSGNMWITSDQGIRVINEKKESITEIGIDQGLRDSICMQMICDHSGYIWIGTRWGMHIIRPDSYMRILSVNEGLDNSDIRAIAQDRKGMVWIGTQAGLNLLNTGNGTIRNFGIVKGSGGNFIAALLKDNKQRMWIGFRGDGINVVDEKINIVRHLDIQSGLKSNYITSIFQDGRGRLLASASGGVNIIDEQKGTISFFGPENGIHTNSNSVYDYFEDPAGQIWMATIMGIDVWDEKTNTLKQLSFQPGRNSINSIERDQQGNIWVGAGQGVYVINLKEGTWRKVTEGLPTRVVDMIIDSSNRIWIASWESGLSVVNPEHNAATSFTTKQGLSDNSVRSLVEKRKTIYAGTSHGLTAFTDSALTKKIVNQRWQLSTFSKMQGLANLDFESAKAISAKNQLWWGSGNTLTAMDEITGDSSRPETFVTGIDIMEEKGLFKSTKIFNKLGTKDTVWTMSADSFYTASKLPKDTGWTYKNNIYWDDVAGDWQMPVNLSLPYDQNHLTFYFTAALYDNLDKTRFRYVLEGNDKSWSKITDKSYAEYRNLPPGTYTFKVIGKGFNNKWSQPAEFTFTIRPPWWFTWWAYILYALIAVTAIRLFILYRSRKLKKENILLETKVKQRTSELHVALEELKSSQTQLVQQEKMASLGELTAGIAHEIQNPLNFVNNFSEVSNELIEELKGERLKVEGERNAKAEDEIINDISQNLEKINHHGKRADAIVKGMLQHSRSSSGQKEPTDINALCDEYLRLSYHGLRAKDKSFNATIKTDLDPSLEKINIIPQDIGRVILNLLTNAFYAVTEKNKTPHPLKGGNEPYEPTVTISTRRLGSPSELAPNSIRGGGGKVEIRVADNGNGIPQKILDKIFQPFFTTKPTGQGTGLGLSLSYDIAKVHGGEVKVETKEGEGTTFIIVLPT